MTFRAIHPGHRQPRGDGESLFCYYRYLIDDDENWWPDARPEPDEQDMLMIDRLARGDIRELHIADGFVEPTGTIPEDYDTQTPSPLDPPVDWFSPQTLPKPRTRRLASRTPLARHMRAIGMTIWDLACRTRVGYHTAWSVVHFGVRTLRTATKYLDAVDPKREVLHELHLLRPQAYPANRPLNQFHVEP